MHFHLTGHADLDRCSTPWCLSHVKFALTTVEQVSMQSVKPNSPLCCAKDITIIIQYVLLCNSEDLQLFLKGKMRKSCTHPQPMTFQCTLAPFEDKHTL